MSNYHVKSLREDGRAAAVVFHIPIPAEDNSASVSLRTAIAQRVADQQLLSNVPWITAPEQQQLDSGELIEVSETVKFLAADTLLQKQTKIDERFTALSAVVLDKARATLKFWGLNRDVV